MANSRRLPTTVITMAWRLLYNSLSGPVTGVLTTARLGALARAWLGDPGLAPEALLVRSVWPGS